MIHVTLSVVSVFVVCVGAGNLGGNSPVDNSDPAVQQAREMVDNKILDFYPGAKVTNFNPQKQVVNGLRYNLTFTIEYTTSEGSKSEKQCKASVIQAPRQVKLTFVTENGSKEITCE